MTWKEGRARLWLILYGLLFWREMVGCYCTFIRGKAQKVLDVVFYREGHYDLILTSFSISISPFPFLLSSVPSPRSLYWGLPWLHPQLRRIFFFLWHFIYHWTIHCLLLSFCSAFCSEGGWEENGREAKSGKFFLGNVLLLSIHLKGCLWGGKLPGR